MREILIIGPLVFLAGFIDSIAGGGGLISLPAYTLAGIPMHMALGSNKFSSSFGAIMATFEYVRKDRYLKKLALVSALFALIGSFLGARLTLLVADIYLKKILIGVLPLMAIFLLTRKKQVDIKELNISLPLGIIIAFVIGMYDGFLGPGTGSILIFCALRERRKSSTSPAIWPRWRSSWFPAISFSKSRYRSRRSRSWVAASVRATPSNTGRK
jgi:uncharacterized membrane protein YfcA